MKKVCIIIIRLFIIYLLIYSFIYMTSEDRLTYLGLVV